MIVLTAEIEIKGENLSPFVLKESQLGYSTFGTSVDTTFVVNKRNILSLESEIRDRADVDKPSFGVISSGGRLTVKDHNKILLDYANLGLLTDGLEIRVFLHNTLSKNRRLVGRYYTTDWQYDNNNSTVSVSFDDNMDRWQDKPTYSVDIDKTSNSIRTLYEMYNRISNKPNVVISNEVSTIMNKVQSAYFYKNAAHVWADLNKFCEIGAFHVYNTTNGNIVMTAEYDFER